MSKIYNLLLLILTPMFVTGQNDDFLINDSMIVIYNDWTYNLEDGSIINCGLSPDDMSAIYSYWKIVNNDSVVFCQRID